MTRTTDNTYATDHGYMTDAIRQRYINAAIAKRVLPENAHRMAKIISLSAPEDSNTPIQFWQLYSVLGQDRIVKLVANFYARVFRDESWFTSVFARVGGINHHVNTQASMWIDAMGGGMAYHGGEFRLNFHHTHNAIALMNNRGAERWVKLMLETLNDPAIDLTSDPRVRPAINTFLAHFFGKYAEDFNFDYSASFGDTNPPVKRKINFLNMTDDAIDALSEAELKEALQDRGIDISQLTNKVDLVNTALKL